MLFYKIKSIYSVRTFFLFSIIASSFISFSQIRIVDIHLEAIADVFLQQSDNIIGISDQNGTINVDISSNELDKLILSHEHYHTKSISKEILLKKSTVVLHRKINAFSPVIVSAGRVNSYKKNRSIHRNKIEKKEIDLYQPQTSADALNIGNAVYIQKSQQGGGSPNLRGFATNRILLVVDGVRMNTAIFRSGNVQNVISIDPFSIESADIIYGPSSQFYGSDAIGGVIHFNTTKPLLSDSGINFKSKLNIRYSSANSENTYHYQINTGTHKLATLTSVTLSQFGDLKMGENGPSLYQRPDYIVSKFGKDTIYQNDNPNTQIQSGYSQHNILQKITYKPNENIQFDYGFHYSTTSDIPRYDRLSLRSSNDTLSYASWFYGPQEWMLNSLSISYQKKGQLFDEYNSIIAYQNFKESRNSRSYQSVFNKQRKEALKAWSCNADFIKYIHTKTQLNYGLEYVLNQISSQANQINISNQNRSAISTRYPDGSIWKSNGVYVHLKHHWNKNMTSEGGVRLNTTTVNGLMDTLLINHLYPKIENKTKALTGSISHLIRFNNGTAGLTVSSAFRSPNIDDISKIFDSNPGYVTLPNPSLKPELAYNLDLNTEYWINKKLKLQYTFFYTFLDRAITLKNASINGRDSIIYDNVLSQVQMLSNIDFAWIYGHQISFSYSIGQAIKFKTNYTLMKSSSRTGEPLSHITPNYGSTYLDVMVSNCTFSLFTIYNQELTYDKFSDSEKKQAKIYPTQENNLPYSPAWFTFNFRLSYPFGKNTSFNVGVENILDRRYRPYSSGISAPGRNISCSLQVIL